MQSTYKDRLERRSGICLECGREFTGGETIVSAIYLADGEEGFARRDLCTDCFDKAEVEPYSVWRGTQPLPVDDKHRVDFDLALRFLASLVAEADEDRQGLVYVLTLLLSRKRRVKVLETRRGAAGERLVVSIPGDEEDAVVEFPVPTVNAASAERIQAQLAELFGFEPPPPEEPESQESPAEA